MRGSVTADGEEPLLQVSIFPGPFAEASAGASTVEAVVDTGFTGYLSLPPDRVEDLGLTYLGDEILVQANGSREVALVYRATVEWHGRRRPVAVNSVEGPDEALLG